MLKQKIFVANYRPRMKWTHPDKKYYELKGYRFTKEGDEFEVKIEDLPHGSAKKILVVCPVCLKQRYARYAHIVNSGHTICRKCVREKMVGENHPRYGKKNSPEARAKMGHKGSDHPRFGKPCPQEARIKIGKANKGRKHTLEARAKMSESRKGKYCGSNSPHWDPNLTEKNRADRRLLPGYYNWKFEVKKHDNFTCQICGDNKGGNLISHHLYSYTAFPGLRFILSNGVCLCEKCHLAFHEKYGYKNNTVEQFDAYIWDIIFKTVSGAA